MQHSEWDWHFSMKWQACFIKGQILQLILQKVMEALHCSKDCWFHQQVIIPLIPPLDRQTARTTEVSSRHHTWPDQSSRICRWQNSTRSPIRPRCIPFAPKPAHSLHQGRVTTALTMYWRKTAGRLIRSVFLVSGISLEDFLELGKKAGKTTLG